jgi:hypothetical protein
LTPEFTVRYIVSLNENTGPGPRTLHGGRRRQGISAMLANPSCALCGTTERQMQLAFKVKF